MLKTIEDIQVEDIQILKNKLSDESEQATRLYFEKIIDFLKWTTTIALGALLWIGANYHSISNNTLLINTSLASFGLSIMFSFSYVIFILNWMNDTSRLSIERLESTKHLLPSFILAPDAKKNQGEILNKLSKEYKKLSRFLNNLKYLIIFHGVCLVGGTLCFILAILFK